MSTANIIAREDQVDANEDGQRRCIVTGEMLSKDDLIRFVVGPDQTVVADFSHKLPGRGLWVSAECAALETALGKNLFSRAAKEEVKVPKTLLQDLTDLSKKRILDLLGLAKGAGLTTLGQPQVEAAVKTNKIELLLIALDAAPTNLLERSVASRLLNRHELGAAFGYEQVVYVGLKAHSLTEKIRLSLKQLEKITKRPHLDVHTDSRNQ